VVRAVEAAAGRQARLIAGRKSRSQRTKAKEQNQEDRKPTPHLKLGCVISTVCFII
jgi:hypothetical protein